MKSNVPPLTKSSSDNFDILITLEIHNIGSKHDPDDTSNTLYLGFVNEN